MTIEDDDDVEIEVSPLSQKFEENGIEVDVLIYRIAGSSEGWALEVVDEEDASTVWDDLFKSDRDAFDTFMKEVAKVRPIGHYLAGEDDNSLMLFRVLERTFSTGSIHLYHVPTPVNPTPPYPTPSFKSTRLSGFRAILE